MRRVCARVLSNEGWEVVMVDSGKSALATVCDHTARFDCVVADVHMPEMDGFALIAAIRRHDDELPVLLMTGDPSLDGAVRAIDTGAVSYLPKPFAQGRLAPGGARAARRHGVARMRRRETVTLEPDAGDATARFNNALARAWMAFQPIVDLAA